METANKKIHIEGVVIIGIGVFFTILAVLVPKNPVSLDGWINILAQAKTVPLFTGILMILFGLKFTADMYTGKTNAVTATISDKKNALIVLGMMMAYIISVTYFGFKVPTAIFLILILFILNRGRSKPIVIVSAIVLFYIASIVLIPMMLSLRLP